MLWVLPCEHIYKGKLIQPGEVRTQGRHYSIFQYQNRACRKVGEGLFKRVCRWEWFYKQTKCKFILDIRKKYLP